jgi:hypothetical protein
MLFKEIMAIYFGNRVKAQKIAVWAKRKVVQS